MVAAAVVDVRVNDARALSWKLVAFVVMIADHVDWFLYDGALGINATLGRAVFPIFAAVLGINLARMRLAAMPRLMTRLLVAGVVASVPYVYLQGSSLPANVLFTFAASTGVVWLIRRQLPTLAALLALAAGFGVDYLWMGIAAVVAVWWITQRGWSHVQLLVAALLVIPANLSAWSLLAIPLVWLTLGVSGDGPRLKWLFYVGYPAHLAVLALLAWSLK